MTAVFELSIPSEILTTDEVAEITGCGRRSEQIQWLTANGARTPESLANAAGVTSYGKQAGVTGERKPRDGRERPATFNPGRTSVHHAFIRVPETHLPCGIVVPPFEASQFLCSQAPDSRVPRAASSAAHTPWVRISYLTALAACRAAGWSLITEQQWLAIAHDVTGQNANWTGGAFGEGKLLQGLRKRSVLAPVSGMYQPDDQAETRWKVLSNGERICDFGGNAWSWVYDDLQGGPDGVAGIVDADSPSVMTAPDDPRTSGMGIFPPRAGAHRMVWDDRGLIRGGGCRSGKDAGAFALYAALLHGEYVSVGFRATRPILGDSEA